MNKNTKSSNAAKMREASRAIGVFVWTFTLSGVIYIAGIAHFLSHNQLGKNEDPKRWWFSAITVYCMLSMFLNVTLRYIYSTLKNKLKKIQNGVVVDSSQSSECSTTSDDEDK